MLIEHIAHSSFLMTFSDNVTILTDPCEPSTGYTLHDIECDAITSSHDHRDHNYFTAAKACPRIINRPGQYQLGKVKITGLDTWHDDEEGALRGKNTVFSFDDGTTRIVHLGDLGHIPDEKAIMQLTKPDILMVPIGEVFTLALQDVCRLIGMLAPRLVLPMHYQTDILSLSKRLKMADDFLPIVEELGLKSASVKGINAITFRMP